MDVTGKLYFAYGSNLYKPQMRSDSDSDEYNNRCPNSVAVRTYTLKDYRLAFVGEGSQRWGKGGVATVNPASGQVVHGALYRISATDEAELDRNEGVATGHYYKDEGIISIDGENVLVYIAASEMGAENPPSLKYITRIRAGYDLWGLPLAALDNIKPQPE